MIFSLPYYSKLINLVLLDYRQWGIGDGSHHTLLTSEIYQTTLIGWNWPWWEYLHHSTWPVLQIRGFSAPWSLKHWPSHHWRWVSFWWSLSDALMVSVWECRWTACAVTTPEEIKHAPRGETCNRSNSNGPALATCHRCGEGVGLFQLLSALKPGPCCLRLLFFWLSHGLEQGSSSADSAASWLWTDTDLGGQRKSGKVCFQPKYMQRCTVQDLGGSARQHHPLFSNGQLGCTWEQQAFNPGPWSWSSQYRCPKRERNFPQRAPSS